MAISNFIPTIWSEALLHSLDRKYIGVANCNREFEGEIREKGSSVKVCGVGNVNISDYTKNTNMSAPQTLSDNARELVIDQAKYFNFQIDDIDRAQSMPRLMEAAMANAATALATEADRYVYKLYAYAGSTITNAAATPENVVTTLLAARTKLYKQNVSNADDIVFEVSPDIGEMILKAKLELSTDNSEALDAGCIGRIAGCRVYVTGSAVEEDKVGRAAEKLIAVLLHEVSEPAAEHLAHTAVVVLELLLFDAETLVRFLERSAVLENDHSRDH